MNALYRYTVDIPYSFFPTLWTGLEILPEPAQMTSKASIAWKAKREHSIK